MEFDLYKICLNFNCGVGEDSGESLDCKEIQSVHPKGNQSWIFIGRTDAEYEAPTLWPLNVKDWLIRKDSDAGKDWRQEENGTTEGEMVGWHHWLDGHEFEQALGVGDGQGSLACCSPWGHKESDMTERLKNNKAHQCATSWTKPFFSVPSAHIMSITYKPSFLSAAY